MAKNIPGHTTINHEDFQQAKDSLTALDSLLAERIASLKKTVSACEERHDPSSANFNQAVHAYMLYRTYMQDALFRLKMHL